ncbi:MAG: TlpA disulfide reductase family protein [Saprospiraceae bacterium]|nr:TlpA disulfide reductase family protein [Saprospiraceae bacterium]
MKKNSCHWIVTFICLFGFPYLLMGQVKIFEKFDEFNQVVLENISEDTTYVINFWATWCGPCVKELPYFEELNEKYASMAFKQVLVSLDSPRKMDSKVVPFIEENEVKSEVVLLADGKYNNWIDLVDPRWSGAIPITLILKGNEKLFYEKEFHSMEEIEIELLKLFKI